MGAATSKAVGGDENQAITTGGGSMNRDLPPSDAVMPTARGPVTSSALASSASSPKAAVPSQIPPAPPPPSSEASLPSINGENDDNDSPLGAWLRTLGLREHYEDAFVAAGFDSMEVVARLTRADLRSIERRSGVEILPGHQKLLFITARELRRERKRSSAAVQEVASRAIYADQAGEDREKVVRNDAAAQVACSESLDCTLSTGAPSLSPPAASTSESAGSARKVLHESRPARDADADTTELCLQELPTEVCTPAEPPSRVQLGVRPSSDQPTPESTPTEAAKAPAPLEGAVDSSQSSGGGVPSQSPLPATQSRRWKNKLHRFAAPYTRQDVQKFDLRVRELAIRMRVEALQQRLQQSRIASDAAVK